MYIHKTIRTNYKKADKIKVKLARKGLFFTTITNGNKIIFDVVY